VIQQNMASICDGRTVIVIAHRLSAVRHANAIIVLDQGRIVEGGSHVQLVKQGGVYAKLWAMQGGAQA
jgi:subfamily B ATP-binding cassette protein HlyB/CyaB